MRKKRLLFHSDFALAKTGFGRASKALLSHLYKTGKYDIVHLCCGIYSNTPQLNNTPWKSEGAIPVDPHIQQQMQADPNYGRAVSYGSIRIDDLIKEFKPDVYVGTQDIWGVDYSIDKNWFQKINSIIWTTLDSLPLLPSAVNAAPKVKNYWMWAGFAEKAMHKLGHNHVKTVYGPIDDTAFYRLSNEKRKEIRAKLGIDEDTFIIGSVFRNQLRKLVPNKLQGFAEFKRRNPNVKAKLLFHTHLSEGWNVAKLCKEYGVDPKDVLVTYICKACQEYEVKSFDDRTSLYELDPNGAPRVKDGKFIEKQIEVQDKDCKFCHNPKSQITANVSLGVTEDQLNEIYNLMDVYMAVFTSGGMEMPIYEAKLAEIITLVTNYSCGEDACEQGSYSLPLDFATYWEHGTEFEKASVHPSSIAKQLEKVYKMSSNDRIKWGKKAREWAINKCSIEIVGKAFEDFLDNSPFIDETDGSNFISSQEKKWNPNGQLPPVNSNEEFIVALYHNILDSKDVVIGQPDVTHWLHQLNNGMTREQVETTFRNIAFQEIQKKQQVSLEDILDKTGRKRFLIVLKDSAGDIFNSTALLKSWRENHSAEEWDLYYSCDPSYFELLNGNPYIYKLLPYNPAFENELLCIGQGNNPKYFDGYTNLGILSQRQLSYLTNKNLGLELK